MSTWTAEYDGVIKTLAEWGMSQPRRLLQSLGVDTFECLAPALPVDGEPIWAPGATVVIRRDGVAEFIGTVQRVPVFATSQIEGQRYQLANAWSDLDSLVYQQEWYLQVDPAHPEESLVGGLQSRVVLFQGINGVKLSIGAQVADVVAYAASCGVQIQLAADVAAALPITPPFDEGLDLTCGEVIRKVLRWVPDAITWWDYTTTPPTLNVGRRGALLAVDVSLQGPPLASLSIIPRHDLLAPGVVLKYERTHSLDGVIWREVVRDVYPAGADERVPGTVVATIDLEGSSVTHSSATIVTRPFAPATVEWWREREPTLRDPYIAVTRLDPNFTITDESGYEMGPALPEHDDTWMAWTNEVVKGQIAPWMLGPGKVAVSATVSTQCDTAYAPPGWDVQALRQNKHGQPLSARVTLTNLASGTYKTIESATEAEDVPVGIAQEIWAAAGTLQYEGSLTVMAEEVLATPSIGHRLNITGGRPEWASANALIQSVDDDIEAGARTVNFGPPSQLGPADLVELLRFNRQRRISIGWSSRMTGRAPAGGDTPLGEVAANHDSAMGHSGVTSLLSVAEVSDTGYKRAVEIDPQHLSTNVFEGGGGEWGARFHRLHLLMEDGQVVTADFLCQLLYTNNPEGPG
ncbi:MAG: hypothetical protein KIT22_05750 [Verrucomicrobiae bacterium]|nr:hypothetical protein [Verrucomicrobiae bacterium]